MELVSNCGDWSRHFLIHQSAGQTGVCSDNISSIMFAEPDHKAASHLTADKETISENSNTVSSLMCLQCRCCVTVVDVCKWWSHPTASRLQQRAVIHWNIQRCWNYFVLCRNWLGCLALMYKMCIIDAGIKECWTLARLGRTLDTGQARLGCVINSDERLI